MALATVDVSFIGLGLVLPSIASLLAPGGQVIALIKPQFEVGKGQVGKGGVVRDPALHRAAIAKVLAEASAVGLAPGRRDPLAHHRPGRQRGVPGVVGLGEKCL